MLELRELFLVLAPELEKDGKKPSKKNLKSEE
jgi:hypothetical protein